MHKILYVPPNLISDRSRASLLKRRAIELEAADTFAGALQAAEGFKPDLVVFSAQLGGGGAEDFCRKIRLLRDLRGAKLLMITEKLGGGEDLFDLAVDGHLINPVEDAQLIRTIAGLLNVRLRDAERVPVDLIARFDILAKDQQADRTVMVNVLNLSESGLRLEAPEVLQEGTVGRLQFFLPGSKARLSLYCLIRMLADEVLLHYGVELVGTVEPERKLLRDYVRSIQGRAAAPAPEASLSAGEAS